MAVKPVVVKPAAKGVVTPSATAKSTVKPVAKPDTTTAKPVMVATTEAEAPKATAEVLEATTEVATVATPEGAQTAVVTPEPALDEPMVFVKIDPRVPPPTARAVMTSYQRVGRDIMLLQNLRGTECTLELWKTFRAIKLDEATATKEARILTTAMLQDLQAKIERKKGITISQACLDNPLAESCL